MKKLFTFSLLIVGLIITTATQYKSEFSNAPAPIGDELNLGFPEDVMVILERSCFDCHTSESGNMKGKSKLNFSKWSEYKNSKKISKLDAICQEVKEKKMPKKKYVEKHPDKSLSPAETVLICNWVNDKTNKIIGK